jgi:hypothetical protein
MEVTRERFLPECAFRGRDKRKLQLAVLAAAAQRGGAEPDVLDELAWPVPGEQGARRRDPVQAKVPGQDPRQGGDHGAVGPVRLRAAELMVQYRNLVPQDQDLRVL